MKFKPLVAGLALTATVVPSAYAGFGWRAPELFRHIATFDVTRNPGSEVAEIVDVTRDKKTLVYTDSPANLVGFVDIHDPSDPQPDGVLPVGGEPTSVAVWGRHALVGVNTSEVETCTFLDDGEEETISIITDWRGKLVVIDIPTRTIVREIDLGGQPDSVAVSHDGRYAAIAIENERNEDASHGFIPQGRTSTLVDAGKCEYEANFDPTDNPAVPGKLVIVDLKGNNPANWSVRDAESLVGLPGMFAGEDPEPEFVDINRANLAALTLQENNHVAIIELRTGRIVNHFPAGEVELMNVDNDENGLIELTDTLVKRREPDAVAWTDMFSLATANEGDYEDVHGVEGGSRGFTIFNRRGDVQFESYESFEHALVRTGHYNEGRSENKGVEPEAVEYARFGRDRLLFTGSERSNAIGVYALRDWRDPKLLQVLPTGIGPEGLKAIPERNLLVASTETDVFDAGIPTMINIYERQRNGSNYPQIASADDANGLPIPWVALSDLVGDPNDADILYAVSDSFLARGFVYTINVSRRPALIVDRLEVATDEALDLEGIAVGPDGALWLGSEGNTGSRENLVLKIDPVSGSPIPVNASEADGIVELPAGLVDERRGNGIEGIAVTGEAGSEILYVTIQRAWPDEGDTDKVNTKIGRYEVATGEWTFVHYPLEAEGDGDWIGLSGITAMPNGKFWVIERDKGWGDGVQKNKDKGETGFTAELKAIYEVDLANAEFAPCVEDQPLPGIGKTLVKDLTATIAENSIWTAEKLEGFAVSADHKLYAVTDNDGVDDAPGETVFLRLGDLATFGDD